MSQPNRSTPADWPQLDYVGWRETCTSLHLMTQVIGKIRLAQTPWINHSWHVPLYVTARGLGTSPIYHGSRSFEIEFDLIEHRLSIRTSDRREAALLLRPRSTADFYNFVMSSLTDLGLPVSIDRTPSEIADATPFDRDRQPRPYDADAVTHFWRALTQADRIFKEFRARYLGKVSPVHFFWGSFDLAVTRFSGRAAPPHPGGVPNLPDWVAREAYSHEVSSAGFWPGGGGLDYAAFYSYAYPEPTGFPSSEVRPGAAIWSEGLGEFVLPYEAVRQSASPDDTLLDFLQSTYQAAADAAGWDRHLVECGKDWPRGTSGSSPR